jgi:hypothetical protein
MSTGQLAKVLRAMGLPILRFELSDEPDMDDEIYITEDVFVQVGYLQGHYYIANAIVRNAKKDLVAVAHGPQRDPQTFGALVQDVKNLMEAAKTGSLQ